MAATTLKLSLLRTARKEKFQIVDIFMGGGGIIAPVDLRKVKLPKGIDWSKGIILNGRAPIWLYAHLVHKCHIAAWVAVYSPRDGAIVVQSHQKDAPQVGDIIPTERIMKYLPIHTDVRRSRRGRKGSGGIAIAFVGPPHSGKSVLMNAVRLKMRGQLKPRSFQRDFYILRACPDGEGDWFSDIPAKEALTLRYKNRFDDEFVQSVCAHLESLRRQKQILLVDCGGRIDKANQSVWNLCTHAIIVSPDPALFPEWRGALKASEVGILAEVESSIKREARIVSRDPLRMHLGPLERGQEKEIPVPGILVNTIVNTS